MHFKKIKDTKNFLIAKKKEGVFMAVNTISANQVQQMLARNQFSLIIDLRDYYD